MLAGWIRRRGQTVRSHDHLALPAQAVERFLQPGFVSQAIDDQYLGLGQFGNVLGLGLVLVWVDSNRKKRVNS